jgi:hypothetical protein
MHATVSCYPFSPALGKFNLCPIFYNLYSHGSCKQQKTEKDRLFQVGKITKPQMHNVFSNMSCASDQQITFTSHL